MTRADLSAGMQLAQTAHAAFEFSVKYPNIVKAWNDASNNLVCLAARNEDDLGDLLRDLEDLGADLIAVNEPDLDNELTALTIAPHPQARRLLSALPLALKEQRVVSA